MAGSDDDIGAKMGVFTLRFAPALEQRFESETGAARCRALIIGGLIGVAFYLLYLVADYLLTPDRFMLALVLRAGVAVPMSLAVLFALGRNPPPLWRDGMIAFTVLFAGLITPVILLMSDSPMREQQRDAMVLVVLFLVIVQRLRFPVAAASTVVMFTTYVAIQFMLPELGISRILSGIIVFFGVSLLSLAAGYLLERETRRTYLLRLAERRRSDNFESQSRLDPLTGLDNRRALDEALKALGDNTELAIIIADIDHFKSYNDTLGHQAGDVCLRRVGGVLAAELRGPADRAVRFGGEEFLILLPATDLATATAIAERMRKAIVDAQMPHPGRPLQKIVSASFGVASGRVGRGGGAEEIIHGADSALYAAKNAGRNQVWPRPRVRSGEVVTLEDRASGVA